MANFVVTFQLNSNYDDESLNLTNTIEEEYEADDLDALFEILDDPDEMDSIDDASVMNLALEFIDQRYGVYVGQTSKTIEERFIEHKSGNKSGKGLEKMVFN